ncbi:MAG: TlpA family protein disulfide reductase [Tannerella sp.]|jgi:peroxiredoxin|nr:TlpA family protein disulfide reductase [Tannerella sp.]
MNRTKYYFLFAAMFLLSCSFAGKKEQKADAGTENQTPASEEAEDVGGRGYIVKVGDMAPDFTLRLTDGETFKLSALRGKVVMLQFTASWCSVCRREMPFIERDIWQKHKDNSSFCLVGIDRDEPLDKVLTFAGQTGITYPMALDPGGDVFALYAERDAGITRNVIINPEGRITMLTRLYNEEEFNEMKQIIGKLVK